jgi:hypothetical protein
MRWRNNGEVSRRINEVEKIKGLSGSSDEVAKY